MIRIILLTVLVSAATPLCAGALMDQFFPGKKPDKVGQAWFKALPDWLNQLSKEDKHAWSWFREPDAKDAPARLLRYRIAAADAAGLTTYELQETGKFEDDGNPKRTPAKEPTTFAWKAWEKPYLAATYPIESNPKEEDVVAFAAWLYDQKAPLIANRVLTTLYQNPKFELLREPIAEFIREQQDMKNNVELAAYELWDNDFRVFRTILIPADQAEDFKKQRQEAARKRFMELHDDYKVTRTLRLELLEYEVKQWSILFKDTPAVESFSKQQADLLKAIAADLGNIETYMKAGETFLEDKKPDPAKAAEVFGKALELDPCSLFVLSKAANARFQDAHPQLQQTRSRVVGNENAAAAAMELYERWLLVEPANAKPLLCLGQLHHLKGETDKAKKHYARVIELDPDDATTKNARTLKKTADDNPKNQ